ncbi:hypothetical protein BVY03_03920 [bacterium K02(2017)]|nr:hypothetical protein BVY03_03920 [bacterium K02(2017)]
MKKLIIALFFVVSLNNCGGLSSILSSFTSQNLSEVLTLVQQSGCQTVNVNDLQSLVTDVSANDEILDVFGVSKTDVDSLLTNYTTSDQSSLCIFTANVSGSTTHQLYFFTSDDNLSSSTWAASNISITETLSDGTTQTYTPDSITAFSDFSNDAANTNFSFSSVMDYSGSMSSSDISTLESTLTTFYQNLPANFRSEIIKFSSSVQETQSYTDSNSSLVSAIADQTISRGSTALYDGVNTGITNTILETNKVKFVIGFTDGLENSSTATKASVIAAAQASKLPIIMIGMGGFVNLAELIEVTNQTGGFFFYANSNASLSAIFTQLQNYINNTHVISWTSLNSSGVSSVAVTAGNTYNGTYTP